MRSNVLIWGRDSVIFNDELKFEDALVDVLLKCGWNDPGGVIEHPSEQDLIDNWASILFENNKDIDRLNGCPLTQGEMQQIIEQINTLRTPVALNGFINGKVVPITRDNPDDHLHFGKEVSLKIYDRDEIAGGQSRYQIVRQPHYAAKSPLLNSRRGDVTLLINGMPVIHIELKRSGVQVSQAEEQIKKYYHEGVFTGLFSLIQIFVAMTPEQSHYFANPGSVTGFNQNFFFHWADFNNEPVNNWKDVATQLLNIPMAHELIGFYTVADSADGILKVMRSYQYFAASRISDRVFNINRKHAWGAKDTRGGYIWHTTGSGKTMTSFKSAQLIANSKDADKVVFLVDRIELGTQSLGEYRGFADDADDVQATENTDVLKRKLKSDDPANTLIVTSIQKMSNIKEDGGMSARDLEKMRSKRIVFIIDECHRSTFGDMLIDIKASFPDAVFFGFTGTPIHKENQKKNNTTASVFGDELHRYSIADGIRDRNVLGFDPYMVLTFPDNKVRQAVALDKAKAQSVEEAVADPAKSQVFYHYMDKSSVPMEEKRGPEGKGESIEGCLPEVQYGTPTSDVTDHQREVVRDIESNWVALSRGGKFHAIFATHSIAEAIQYYRLLKEHAPSIKVACLFDPNVDNNKGAIFKEDGLVELLKDYNARYGKEFTLPTFAAYKKDLAARLAHKKPYVGIENTPEECVDLLVVVDQMLTGFDSKWINTLYLDKVLRYESIIQAFSRTNRLFGPDKPFGVIRYYRRPHTMKYEIEEAVKLYSGDRPLGLFVDKLPENIAGMNRCFHEIEALFQAAGVGDFERLPQADAEKAKFASLFKSLNEFLEAARVQGFVWGKDEYDYDEEDGESAQIMTLCFDETIYLTLALRYKELFTGGGGSEGSEFTDVPFDIDAHLIEIDTGYIDTEYMNSNFNKWLKELAGGEADAEAAGRALEELHRSFATLTQDEQRCAELFIHDIQCGDAKIEAGKTFRDYVTDYQQRSKNQQLARVVEELGVDEGKLVSLMAAKVTPANINEFDRFDDILQTLDIAKARSFFERKEGATVPVFKVRARADALLREFILEGGFDIE